MDNATTISRKVKPRPDGGPPAHASRALLKRAIESGDVRKDLDPLDLLRTLIGVANVATSPDWQQSAKRQVDILIIGSRPIS